MRLFRHLSKVSLIVTPFTKSLKFFCYITYRTLIFWISGYERGNFSSNSLTASHFTSYLSNNFERGFIVFGDNKL